MKDIAFEKALEKLEKIVKELEAGEISLDASLKKYEEGINLANLCQHKLDKAKSKVEALTKKEDGSFDVKRFASSGDK
ncbi:MAG: exodeoxyribonuclease VII small subunit [Candidatus Omnitrophota bacterium]